MRIALHQMCSNITPAHNLQTMSEGIRRAAGEGAQFYFAPEMALLLDQRRSRAANHIGYEQDDEAVAKLCALAGELGIWLHIGSLALRSESEPTKCVNRSLVIDDKGMIRARYDKMHLFDVALDTGEEWRESAGYSAGDRPVIAQTPLGPMGLSICYDLRFPNLYSAYAAAGADVMAIPAAFTVPTGEAHWHVLLRARAIESQAFVIAAAQSGKHEDGRETYGHSLVIDPWGEILLDLRNGEGLGFAEIDLSRLDKARRQIPMRDNKRNIGPVRICD